MIIILVLALIILAILFKYVSFSKTTVEVKDTEGNVISGASVSIGYSCDQVILDVGGGKHPRSFGTRETITNKNGIAKFNSLNKFFIFNFPFMYNCKKYVSSRKDGYCNDRFYSKNIEEPCWIDHGKVSEFIGFNEDSATLILEEVKNYEEYKKETKNSCNIYPETCLEYEEFNDLLITKDPSICNEKFISDNSKENLIIACEQRMENEKDLTIYLCLEDYKSKPDQISWRELNSECYIEIAFATKVVSHCNNIIDMGAQTKCFEVLAIELKDPSLCKNNGNDRAYEYCKLEAIKRNGNINLCSEINIKDFQDLCEVALS